MVKKLTMVAKETIILTKRSYSLFITTQSPAFYGGAFVLYKLLLSELDLCLRVRQKRNFQISVHRSDLIDESLFLFLILHADPEAKLEHGPHSGCLDADALMGFKIFIKSAVEHIVVIERFRYGDLEKLILRRFMFEDRKH